MAKLFNLRTTFPEIGKISVSNFSRISTISTLPKFRKNGDRARAAAAPPPWRPCLSCGNVEISMASSCCWYLRKRVTMRIRWWHISIGIVSTSFLPSFLFRSFPISRPIYLHGDTRDGWLLVELPQNTWDNAGEGEGWEKKRRRGNIFALIRLIVFARHEARSDGQEWQYSTRCYVVLRDPHGIRLKLNPSTASEGAGLKHVFGGAFYKVWKGKISLYNKGWIWFNFVPSVFLDFRERERKNLGIRGI